MFLSSLTQRSCIRVFAAPSIGVKTFKFSTSSFIYAKNNKKSKNSKKEDEAVGDSAGESLLELDFDKITSKFKNVLESFNKQATEAKLGKTNPTIFDKLKVEISGLEKLPFTSVAQTTIKGGRNFLITVFDPLHTQSIINAVLGSGLNMNPQRDPINKQTLMVPLPPPTVESRKEAAKSLKQIFEKSKNGSSSDTLAGVRSDVKNQITKHQKKKKKLTDAENKLVKDFDKLHKEFTDKLNDAFKAAEKGLLK